MRGEREANCGNATPWSTVLTVTFQRQRRQTQHGRAGWLAAHVTPTHDAPPPPKRTDLVNGKWVVTLRAHLQRAIIPSVAVVTLATVHLRTVPMLVVGDVVKPRHSGHTHTLPVVVAVVLAHATLACVALETVETLARSCDVVAQPHVGARRRVVRVVGAERDVRPRLPLRAHAARAVGAFVAAVATALTIHQVALPVLVAQVRARQGMDNVDGCVQAHDTNCQHGAPHGGGV